MTASDRDQRGHEREPDCQRNCSIYSQIIGREFGHLMRYPIGGIANGKKDNAQVVTEKNRQRQAQIRPGVLAPVFGGLTFG